MTIFSFDLEESKRRRWPHVALQLIGSAPCLVNILSTKDSQDPSDKTIDDVSIAASRA